MAGRFKFFDGARHRGRPAVFVRITSDDGTVGWGQSVPIARWSYETLETATIVLRDYFAPVLIGRDPTDIEGIHAVLDQTIAPGFSTGMPISRAGIDLALHDLAGRLERKSVAELWGRRAGGRLPLSWTVNPRSLDEVDSLIEEGLRRGYRHFNIKVAPDVAFDVAIARRVRERVPCGFLWADANGGYEDVETAMDAARRLADAGVDVLESPLRPNRISGYQRLRRQGALPILMDEGIVSPVELEEFLRLDMLDGVAMKPSRCGGLLSARRQIERLIAHGRMWLGSGLTDPDLSLAASLVLFSAYGLDRPAALNGPQFLTAHVLQQPVVVAEGEATVPTGPGLGVDVDPRRVEAIACAERSA